MTFPSAEFTLYLANVLWQGSLLLGVVWLFDRLTPRLTPASKAALWAVALLALPWLPFAADGVRALGLPSLSLSLPVSLEAPAGKPVSTMETDARLPVVLPAEAPASAQAWRARALHHGVGAAYLAGLVVAGAWLLGQLFRLHRWTVDAVPATDPRWIDTLTVARACMGVRSPCFLMSGTRVPTPLSMGLFHYRILLPSKLPGCLTDEELRDLFLHELGHIRRGDPVMLLLLAGLRAACFFHPLVWLGVRRYRSLAERAVDRSVISATREPLAYGRFLARVAEAHLVPASLLSPGVLGVRDELSGRIAALFDRRPERLDRRTPLYCAGVLALGFALALIPAFRAAEDTVRIRVGDIIGERPLASMGEAGHGGADGLSRGAFRSPFADVSIYGGADSPRSDLVATAFARLAAARGIDNDHAPSVGATHHVRRQLGLLLPVAIHEYGHWHGRSEAEKTTYFKGVDALGQGWFFALDRRYHAPGAGAWLWQTNRLDEPAARIPPESSADHAILLLLDDWLAHRLLPAERAALFDGRNNNWVHWTEESSESNILIGVVEALQTMLKLRAR